MRRTEIWCSAAAPLRGRLKEMDVLLPVAAQFRNRHVSALSGEGGEVFSPTVLIIDDMETLCHSVYLHIITLVAVSAVLEFLLQQLTDGEGKEGIWKPPGPDSHFVFSTMWST